MSVKKPQRPIEEIVAGDNFRNTMIPRADVPGDLLWHGWVIMEAFLAGIDWARANSPNHSIGQHSEKP